MLQQVFFIQCNLLFSCSLIVNCVQFDYFNKLDIEHKYKLNLSILVQKFLQGLKIDVGENDLYFENGR